MSTSRFTVTSLLLLAIIISVIGFLFTVLLPELSAYQDVLHRIEIPNRR